MEPILATEAPSDRPAEGEVVALTQALVRCPSVTPRDGGAMQVLCRALGAAGFQVDLFASGQGEHFVQNLVAVRGSGGPVLAFAGHADVVPAGELEAWAHPPFAGVLADGAVHGRGAVDMKGALAAFVAAAGRSSRARGAGQGTLMVLVTGDEEEGSPQGMRAVLSHLRGRGHPTPQACLIGEPSCEGFFGQGLRAGRRGSLNVRACAPGVSGHVAWPDRAQNALHRLLDFLGRVRRLPLGPAEGCFPASHVEITQVSSDSHVSNLIPGRAEARLNIRFNRRWSGESLCAALRRVAEQSAPPIQLSFALSGEPYMTENSPLADIVADAVLQVTGHRPERNAGGGVSDGRFIRQLCPVIEFGLVGDLAHKVDEYVGTAELAALEDIYRQTLAGFFA